MNNSDLLIIDIFGLKTDCSKIAIKGIRVIDEKRFNFYIAEINGKQFIVAQYMGEPIGAAQMHDQLQRFSKLSGFEVAVYLDNITYSRRAAYMNKGIPFIVRNRQVYIPFLGMSLTKRCDSETNNRENKSIKLSTQLLLLYYIYSDSELIKLTEANETLGYSRMTLSRAGRELIETTLFEAYKEGTSIVLRGKKTKRELFEELSGRFTSPDKFIGYSTIDRIDSQYTSGGADALAHRSMLDFGWIPEYATNIKNIEVEGDYFDADTAVRIYQWKYDPLLFSSDGFIDPLSVAISLRDNVDERVQNCIEEMLDEFWKSRGNK